MSACINVTSIQTLASKLAPSSINLNNTKTSLNYVFFAFVFFFALSACDVQTPELKGDGGSTTSNEEALTQYGFVAVGDISKVSDGERVTHQKWAVVIDASNIDGENAQFRIVENSNPTLFKQQPNISYPNGDLTFVTNKGVAGTATLYVVFDRDGSGNFSNEDIYEFSIKVSSNSVNLAPVFSVGDNIETESNSAKEFPGWIKSASDGNDSQQHLSFEITENSNPELFQQQPWVSYPSLTLRFTPVQGASGTAHLKIRLRDNGGTANEGTDTSSEQPFTITLIANNQESNSPPVFVVGKDVTVSMNSGSFTRPNWVSSVSDGDNNSQALEFVITDNDSPQLFDEQPWVSYPSKSLRFKPKQNAIGTAVITIHVLEKSTGFRSESQTFRIHILSQAENNAPTFKGGPDVSVKMNSGDAAFPAWATEMDDSDNEIQGLNFEVVSVEKSHLFSSQPRVSVPSGTLRFRPALDQHGKSLVSIRLKDSGDGNNVSEIVTFTITITTEDHVENKSPTVADIISNTDYETTVSIILKGQDSDNDALSYVVDSLPSHGSVVLTGDTVSYTPANGYSGQDSFTYYATDGNDKSNSAIVKITINDKTNKAPIAEALQYNLVQGESTNITLLGDDPDGDSITYQTLTHPSVGILSGSAPNLEYIAPSDFLGNVSFSYLVSDGSLESEPKQVIISISTVNRPPLAQNDKHTLPADSTIKFDLKLSDEDGDSLSAEITSQPSHGTVTLTGLSVTYTPDSGFSGTDQFSYRASDGIDDSNVATINFVVEENTTNTAPFASSASFTILEDSELSGLLVSSDKENDPITYSIVTPPKHGTLSGDYPIFIYTPNQDYHGDDSLIFQANDGQLDSNLATIDLVITPQNDVPVAHSSEYSTSEESEISFTLSANDSDGDSLTYSLIQNPIHGVLSGTAPLLTYTPNKDYSGLDSLTFNVSDATETSNTAKITITVTPQNDRPVVTDVSLTTKEDTPLNITLSGQDNDSDVLNFQIVTPTTNGVVSKNGAQYTYTPNSNYNGQDQFSYKANDGTSDSNTAIVSITVEPVNDAPIAISKTVTTPSFTELQIPLDATDVEQDSLEWTILSQAINGSVYINGSDVSYLSQIGFIGEDSFTFQVDDGTTKSNIATVTIIVGSDSYAPVADNQHFTILENATASIVATGSDLDNDPLTFKIFAHPTHGQLSGTLPNLTYTPNLGFVGNDRFTYASNDGTSDSPPAFVTITVQSTNDAPVAINGASSTTEDTELAISLDAYDQDGDNLDWRIDTQPQNGTLSGLAPDLSYIPNTDYNGIDEFSFVVNDGEQDSNTGTYAITIAGSNDQPTALAQSLTINEDENLNITLDGTDKELDALSYTIVSAPSNGALSGNPPNIIYTPQQGFFGSDVFTFRVNDGTSDSEYASVAIDVLAVNDAPVATPQTVNLDEDTATSITLTANDPEGDSLSYLITQEPSNGTITGSHDHWTYTPVLNFSGTDRFEFLVEDQSLSSSPAAVVLNVQAKNDAPTANNAQYVTKENKELVIILEGSDPENDALNTTIINDPTQGELTGQAPNLVYTPSVDYIGTDSFQFVVHDSEYTSITATVSITVEPNENIAPIADAGGDASTPSNSALTLSGKDSSDIDNDNLTYQWTILEVPSENTVATLSSNNTESTLFTSDEIGSHKVGLIVNDGQLDSIQDTVSITVTAPNQRPVADAGRNRTIQPNQTIALDGSNSYDPEFGDITFLWQITNQPQGSSSQLSSPVSIGPLFQADTVGDYTISLVVNDGLNDSAVDEITVTVSDSTSTNSKPTAIAEYAIGIDDFEDLFLRLDASQSFDPDGDILNYQWTLLSQHQDYDSIPDNESEKLEWATPPDNQRIQLIVDDGTLFSDPVVIDILNTASMSPVALFDAEDRLVETGDEVALEVDAWDYDSDITFQWTLVSKPSTSLAEIDESSSQFTFFSADIAGTYIVEIEVSDGTPSGIVKRSLNIFANKPGNTPPVPVTNDDESLFLTQSNLTINLDASNSFDADGDSLGYFWTITRPDQSKAKLNDQYSSTAKFSVDLPGEYNATLYLDDGYTQVTHDIEFRVIRETNLSPVADAGNDLTGSTDTLLSLDGSASYDDDGDYLTYYWQLISRPSNSANILDVNNSAQEKPSFTPTEPGTYVFSLNVSDWAAISNTDTITVTVVEANEAPTADTGQLSGTPSIVTTFDEIQLDGSSSSDPENSPLNYLWSVASAPAGSSAQIVGHNTINPVFTPDIQGHYKVKLKVNDGELDSQYAFYTIWAYNTSNKAPIAIAEDPITDFIDTVIYLDGSAAYDPDGDEISRRWHTTFGPTGAIVTIIPPNDAKPFFQANLPGLYFIAYVVSDGDRTSDIYYQRIHLIGPTPPVANAG